MTSDPPKVLISYSHDSPEHAQHVLELGIVTQSARMSWRLRKAVRAGWTNKFEIPTS